MQDTTKQRKLLWGLLLIAIILGALWELYPLSSAQARIEVIPYEGHYFVSENFPLNEIEQERLHGAFVQKRFVHFNKQNFFITFIDGTHNRHIVHDPKYCFLGGGMRILSSKEIPLARGHGKLLQLSLNTKTYQAAYWFSDGKTQYTSPLRYWLATVLRRLTLGLFSEEPILVIFQPADPVPVNWNRIAHELLPFLNV